MNVLWVIEKKSFKGHWVFDGTYPTRETCRVACRYYNGFAHGTKRATHRVCKYMKVKL